MESPQTCFEINRPTIVYEMIDNEVVIIDFDSGSYYSLGKAGADIWGLVEAGAPVSVIVEEIAQRYEGERAQIEDATRRLLAELEKENLIAPAGAQGHAGIEMPTAPAASGGKPRFEPPVLHKYTDMQELLLLDPIHDVDETGWPNVAPDAIGSEYDG